jgi:hypothetical protein
MQLGTRFALALLTIIQFSAASAEDAPSMSALGH